MTFGSKQAGWMVAAAPILALALALLPAGAAADADPHQAVDLDSSTCLSCHDGSMRLRTVDAEGARRALHPVDPAGFVRGVHSDMQCIDCHREITDDASEGHEIDPDARRPDCVQCHLELQEAATPQRPLSERSKILAENIRSYETSFHARPDADKPHRPNASCNDCHNVHSFEVPPAGTAKRIDWRLEISAQCGNCHDFHFDLWSESVHGRAVLQDRNTQAAVCTDCHTAHDVQRTRAEQVKLAITKDCGNCHDDAYRSYQYTYHGKITTLGYAHTAKCFDCHGSHDIEPSSNPVSMMHMDNRLETCQSCHDGEKISLATRGYLSYSPHAVHDDFANYPEIWLADKMMKGLLIGTFSFFWLHTLLWFFREYKDRKAHGALRHIKLPPLPGRLEGKHFRRFSRTWRAAHLLFALSLMLLTLTGIPLFFPEAVWAQPLMTMLGGPEMAGLIHRINAVIFAGVFFWHLVYLMFTVDWKNFKLFGPNSLVPGLQDLKDIIAMFKWFFHMGPRPTFDRWTYWEKFDYWAPFWGVTIIGVSGLMMWIPSTVAQYLPGWVLSVATIFHSEEAFLAVVFLFTVHFFNNHFRPDKFPLDRVMFTGTMSLDEFKHEHPLQYQRLFESGELEQHLVDPPSKAQVQASTLLGFILIVVGLTLLTLVAIGFFTHL
jgi:cytochrome b subunit of formate dehydrogenase